MAERRKTTPPAGAATFDPILRIEHDGVSFDLHGLKAQEMAQVKGWTQLPNRREFYQAIRNEDPDAIIAAFTIARQRAGEDDLEFVDVDVDLDALQVSLVDATGRKVDPVLETNKDGTPRRVKTDPNGMLIRRNGELIDDPNGRPVHAVDSQGRPRWRYIDTGEPVIPPTQAAETTTSPATTGQPGAGTGSASGTPTTGRP